LCSVQELSRDTAGIFSERPDARATRDVRQTLLTQAWREPRSFTTRYATLFADLSTQERSARLRRVAAALTHPAIPEVERHHLYITMHHGH